MREYTKIFETNVRARHFEITYLDAFAGTGTLAGPETDPLIPSLLPELTEDVDEYQRGSVRRALEIQPEFDHYIFIEKDKVRFNELQAIRQEFPDRDIKVENLDANDFLKIWCTTFNAAKSRAVVFLDPFGANVSWETISLIGMTKAVDLWLLFPLFAVNRMLIKDRKPFPAWAKRLTDLFGTPDWEREFYTSHKDGLPGFEGLERIEKIADTVKISRFLVRRLKQEFVDAAEPRILYNSKRSPLYLFCFAAGNEKGATIGLRIAKYLLEH